MKNYTIIVAICTLVATVALPPCTYGQGTERRSCATFHLDADIGIIQNYLEIIPEGHEHYYGFEWRDEFERVSLGAPLRIHRLEQEEALEGVQKHITVQTNGWYLPLELDDRMPCFIYLQEGESGCRMVGLGLMGVASDLNVERGARGPKRYEGKALLLDLTMGFAAIIEDTPEGTKYVPFKAVGIHGLSRGRSYSRNEMFDVISLELNARKQKK